MTKAYACGNIAISIPRVRLQNLKYRANNLGGSEEYKVLIRDDRKKVGK
jgi:hypothetical protein